MRDAVESAVVSFSPNTHPQSGRDDDEADPHPQFITKRTSVRTVARPDVTVTSSPSTAFNEFQSKDSFWAARVTSSCPLLLIVSQEVSVWSAGASAGERDVIVKSSSKRGNLGDLFCFKESMAAADRDSTRKWDLISGNCDSSVRKERLSLIPCSGLEPALQLLAVASDSETPTDWRTITRQGPGTEGHARLYCSTGTPRYAFFPGRQRL